MTAINWATLFMGFLLLLVVIFWVTGEVTARRRHREKVEMIKLGQKPTITDRHADER